MKHIIDISRVISANFGATITGEVALFAMYPVIIPENVQYIGNFIASYPEAQQVNKQLTSLPHIVNGILIPMPHDVASHILEDATPSKRFFYQLYLLLKHSNLKVLLSLIDTAAQKHLKNVIASIDQAEHQARPELVNCIKYDRVKETIIKQAKQTWAN